MFPRVNEKLCTQLEYYLIQISDDYYVNYVVNLECLDCLGARLAVVLGADFVVGGDQEGM